MTKKLIAVVGVLILALSALAYTNPNGSPEWSLERAGSTVRIDSVGQIRVEPRSGKGVTFGSGTLNFTGATVTNLNASAIAAGTLSAGRLPTAMNSMTFATGKTVALTDADSLLVGGVIVPQALNLNWTNIGAANASGDYVFIAQRAYQVTSIKIAQRAQGGSGCVVDVEKLTSTTAPGSGTVLGTSSYNCNSTANNTVTTYTLTGTTGTLQLAAGDRLGLKLAGTLTALAGATVTIQLKAI